jgi:hypothetical protein
VARSWEGALKGNDKPLSMLLQYADRVLGGMAMEAPGGISKDDQAILDAFREEIRAETTKDDTGSRSDDSEDPK